MVSWAPSPSPLTYDIWRGTTTNLADASAIAQFLTPGPNYTDTNAAPGFEYFYWIRARNGFGPGEFGGPVRGLLGSDGRDLWHYYLPGFVVLGTAVSSDGTIYIAANSRWGFPRLIALNPQGDELWTTHLAEPISGPPVVGLNGNIYVQTSLYGYGTFQAYNRDGIFLWEIREQATFQPPAVGSTGDLYALTDKSGYILHPDGQNPVSLLLSSPARSCPPLLLGEAGLYHGAGYGIGLSLLQNTQVWVNSSLGGPLLGMAPAPGGGIYTVSDTGVRALNSDGAQRWHLPGTDYASGPVLGADGTLYVGSRSNALVALTQLAATSGPLRQRARSRTPGSRSGRRHILRRLGRHDPCRQ